MFRSGLSIFKAIRIIHILIHCYLSERPYACTYSFTHESKFNFQLYNVNHVHKCVLLSNQLHIGAPPSSKYDILRFYGIKDSLQQS